MAVAREKEVGTIETLISSPLDSWDLLMGKTVPFIILGSLQTPLILGFAVLAFGLPIRGPFWMLTVASILMVVATVAIGLMISTFAKDQQQAMLGGFMYLFPSYLLSGLMFPIENMPFYFQPFAYINPLTHYMGLLRNILLVGGELRYFCVHSLIILSIAIALGWIALRRFRSMLT
jgi:ABC-2 type transport system permease protein